MIKIIVSDIDSTLVDQTYDLSPTAPKLIDFLLHDGYLVFATTKTLDEVLLYAEKWSLPKNKVYIISEAGGLIAGVDLLKYDWNCKGYRVLELGERLVEQDLEIARQLNCGIKGYRDMSLDELGEIAGLKGEFARAARMRLFTESLYSTDRDCLKILAEKYRSKGYFVHIGSRFLTIGKIPGKRAGINILLTLSSKFTVTDTFTLGFGDADMDAEMLEDTDMAFLIPSYAKVSLKRSDYIKSPNPAPEGWIFLYDRYVKNLLL
ncbi:MAG: HAD hydrolase family protein [Desulfurococcales archaeon]|nr:HAD hydrolase family protein [Desulfurococcales archaeon]